MCSSDLEPEPVAAAAEDSREGISNTEAAGKEIGGENKRKRTEITDNSGVMMPPPSTPAKKIKRAPSDVERTPVNIRNQAIWHETSILHKKVCSLFFSRLFNILLTDSLILHRLRKGTLELLWFHRMNHRF